MDFSLYMKTEEAAERLQVKPNQIRRLCQHGKLNAVKWGIAWMIERESVESYANSERKIGRPPNEPPDVEPSTQYFSSSSSNSPS